jgi:Zn-finger nucleic acid-binding protein
MKVKKTPGTKESALELKYCERCGGLWLRPVGGEQIYCRICARAMAELPPPSTEVKRKMTRREDWEVEEEFEGYTMAEIELDEEGGWA